MKLSTVIKSLLVKVTSEDPNKNHGSTINLEVGDNGITWAILREYMSSLKNMQLYTKSWQISTKVTKVVVEGLLLLLPLLLHQQRLVQLLLPHQQQLVLLPHRQHLVHKTGESLKQLLMTW